ncbi:MAG TPA: globin [Microbacteriaceae bacterium]
MDNGLFERLGGEHTFTTIARVFYQHVSEDPVLHEMYPEEDLAPAEERLRLFLIQYWGGPSYYQEKRGHPRLRMRHMPFKVNPKAKEHWLKAMRAAVDEAQLSEADDALVWDYFERAAIAMVNTFED